jgi:hypothetical protein
MLAVSRRQLVVHRVTLPSTRLVAS